MSRSIKLPQIDQEEQLLVRLAWACEVEGLTQADAAERFGITRLRVNKALSEARRPRHSACERGFDLRRLGRARMATAATVPSGPRCCRSLPR